MHVSSRRYHRRTVAAVLCLTSLAVSFALARNGVVTLHDNTTITGDVTEVDNGNVIAIRNRQGIDVRVTRDRVARIEYQEEPELEYNRQYKNLDKKDVDGRIKLAQYCMDNRRPDLAKQVLLEALQIDPNRQDASSLYEAAKSQIELDKQAKARAANPPPVTTPAVPATVSPTAPPSAPPVFPAIPELPDPRATGPSTGPATTEATMPPPAFRRLHRPTLDADQVNMVRQAELRRGDTTGAIRFDNDVERRFATSKLISINALRQLSPVDRFFTIKNSDPSFLKDVKLLRDPAPLMEFKRLQPRILLGCASAGCHGGERAGSFALISPADSDAATTTNFYLLATGKGTVTRTDGKKSNLKIIDRTQPAQSLLLQFALDPRIAQFSHPMVPGYKPMFRSIEDPGFQALLNWIETSLTPIDPDYGFQFTVASPSSPSAPPAAPATTQPATDTPPAPISPASPTETVPSDGGTAPRPGPKTDRPVSPFEPGNPATPTDPHPAPGNPPMNPPR